MTHAHTLQHENIAAKCATYEHQLAQWFTPYERSLIAHATALLEALKECATLLKHAERFFKYQSAGHEFYPNREAVDAVLNEARALLTQIENG